MKNIILTLGLVLVSSLLFCQDTIRIKHTNYTTVFSKSKHYPVLVEWWTTKSMVSCSTPLKRKDNFKPDPQLINETNLSKDYVGSGLDKGHVMPAADNLCQTPRIQDECFYFSNMIPQPHYSNAGPWKKIEVMTRELSLKNDSIHVWSGAVGVIRVFGVSKISIPTKTWKVIYIKKTKTYISYIFPNTDEKIRDVETLRVKKINVEKLTGFKFNVK
jgi:endonuclease G